MFDGTEDPELAARLKRLGRAVLARNALKGT